MTDVHDRRGARVAPVLEISRLDVTISIRIEQRSAAPANFQDLVGRVNRLAEDLTELGCEVYSNIDELAFELPRAEQLPRAEAAS